MKAAEQFPVEISFQGPYPLWEGGENWALGLAARFSGIYLFTIPVGDEHRVLYVGEADLIANRIRKHIGCYLSGRYWLWDPDELKQGRLKDVWKPTSNAEVALKRFKELQAAIEGMLPLVSVFVCQLNVDKSCLRRIESSLIQAFQNAERSRDFLENDRLSVRYRLEPSVLSVRSSVAICELPTLLKA